MSRTLRAIAGAVLGLTLLGVSAQSAVAEYPEGPVRVVVPYAPGGGTDTLARRIAIKLGDQLGKQVVVENIGGAGGNIGMRSVAEANPDGYTLVFALNSQFAVNISLFDSIPFDPIKDFKPVSLVGQTPYVLVVHPSLEVSTVNELVAVAEKRPGELSYGSAGIGSGAHLATELFKTITGVDMLHSPYKGAGDAYPDLLGGRIQVMFSTYAPVAGYIASGQLKAIAVAGLEAFEGLPEVPTVASTFPGFEATTWYAMAAPAGTPDAIVARVNEALVAALQDPELRTQVQADAIELIGSTPDEFATYLPAEIEKWAGVVKASGASVQ